MTALALPARKLPGSRADVVRWPVRAIVVLVGGFSAVVASMLAADVIVGGEPLDATARIILGATLLRALLVAMALASVQRWGERLPSRALLAGLWAAAFGQLAYPASEAVAKLVILVGAVEASGQGVGNMSATGWFNFAAVWLAFGIPGVLFGLAARNYARRTGQGPWMALVGGVGGVVALLAIGVVISV